MKTCTKCKREFPATREYFYSDSRKSDGLYCRCKGCHYKTTENYRHKNPHVGKECAKKYRATVAGRVNRILDSIRQRCYNESSVGYEYWGGKGITLEFTRQELVNWLSENNIDPRGLDIHRIDTDGNYSLSNIEFLTRSEHTVFHNSRRVYL